VTLLDEVRESCRALTLSARHVSIDLDAAPSLQAATPASLDPERHYLEGETADVAAYLLALDAINFGSGWFPTLRKRPGCSGYFTVAWALADRFREHGTWSNAELRALDRSDVASTLKQDEAHPLMTLYAEALRDLGRFLGARGALDLVAEADASAERLATQLARGMRFFDDRGFYKRAQITANDLALAGVAEFDDLDRLTIFADNLVPHVLRVDGVLRYEPELAAHIDAGKLLPAGPAEREIRACAVHACELLSQRTGIAPRMLDVTLWNRGQAPEYKAIPRHRTRSVFY
jgi:Potential Queuosine, Q, salvage protein family